jgi:hypothetical protein
VDALRKLDGKDALTNKAHAVIYLQLAQLENASSAFGSAVTRMDADLEQIAGRINRMLEHSASLSGASAGSESSLHVQMDECFRAIAHASADRSQLDRQTASAFASLQDTLDSLKRSAFEIHRVELQLRWLAINAAISAAHIGEKGEPLEAIAAAMQQLLADCEKSSSAADQSIGSISEIFRLALAGANVSENEGSDELLQRLGNQIDQLHSLDERSASRTAELASTASRLSAEVEQLRDEFSAGRLFASAAANCCTVLRRIQEQVGANQTTSDYAQLHELKQQYTMQAELDIHNRIFASQAPEASDTEVVMVSEPVASGEFDDNVELF